MALTKCYECKKDVSEIAEKCPNCGAPVISEIKTHASNVAQHRTVSGLLFFGGMAWLAIDAFVFGADEFAKDFKWAGGTMGAGVLYYILGEIARNIDERKLQKQRIKERKNQ